MPANAPYGLQFWRDELARATSVSEQRHTAWQENLDYYSGTPLKDAPSTDYVNVNVDFYQVETKVSQLFFESPELQASPGVGFEPTAPGVLAFKTLLNAILGPDHIDALTTTLKGIKSCTAVSGFGPTVIGYQPTMQTVPADGVEQPGAILKLSQPTPVPVYEQWFWDTIPNKKFLIPADFNDTDYDRAPWLGMKFRLPLRAAKLICNLPPNFTGTQTKDDNVLKSGPEADDASSMPYVDGAIIWYLAYLFDDDEIHPLIYRRHIVIDGLDTFADNNDPAWRSPYQTKLMDGRLSGDSMIGNPIHPLVIRDLPDSAYPPADSAMTRPLVKELCLFRSQMVRERDVNTPKFAYKATALAGEVDKIEAAMTGSMIGLPDAAFVPSLEANFKLLAQGSSPRQTYLASDYITKDIEKTLGIDSSGAGVADDQDETATKTAEVARSRNVRLDAERKRVLRWYLKGVDKVAALVLRFCTDPQRVAEFIGPEQAQQYLQWRELIVQSGDARPKFTAKPDSQIKMDAAQVRRSLLQSYEYVAKDPLAFALRVQILRKIAEMNGLDPSGVTDQSPEQQPEVSLGYSFKGEDLNPNSPQFPIVVKVLAAAGVEIDQATIDEAKDGALNQVLMGQLTPTNASPKAATKTPQAHGGLADKMSPLSKHGAEETGNRPGPSVS